MWWCIIGLSQYPAQFCLANIDLWTNLKKNLRILVFHCHASRYCKRTRFSNKISLVWLYIVLGNLLRIRLTVKSSFFCQPTELFFRNIADSDFIVYLFNLISLSSIQRKLVRFVNIYLLCYHIQPLDKHKFLIA